MLPRRRGDGLKDSPDSTSSRLHSYSPSPSPRLDRGSSSPQNRRSGQEWARHSASPKYDFDISHVSDMIRDSILTEDQSITLSRGRDETGGVQPADLETISTIGKGINCHTTMCRRRTDNSVFLVRKMNSRAYFPHEDNLTEVMVEITISAAGESDVEIVGFYEDRRQKYVSAVMSGVVGDDLWDAMNDAPFSVDKTSSLFGLVLKAVGSASRFRHYELRPDLLMTDKSGNFRLSPFGRFVPFVVADMEVEDKTRTRDPPNSSHLALKAMWRSKRTFMDWSEKGLIYYLSPEVLSGETSDQEHCVMWSLGVILYEMVVGYPPFLQKTDSQCHWRAVDWANTLRFPPEVELADGIKGVIKRLLCDAPSRMSFEELVEVDFNAMQGLRLPQLDLV